MGGERFCSSTKTAEASTRVPRRHQLHVGCDDDEVALVDEVRGGAFTQTQPEPRGRLMV
jgi:hypothetical protein